MTRATMTIASFSFRCPECGGNVSGEHVEGDIATGRPCDGCSATYTAQLTRSPSNDQQPMKVRGNGDEKTAAAGLTARFGPLLEAIGASRTCYECGVWGFGSFCLRCTKTIRRCYEEMTIDQE